MGTNRTIDDIDRHILAILQRNSRVPNVELAKQVGLAPSAVLERVRKLEHDRLVRAYTALLDPKALGYRMLAFVAVRTAEDPPGEDRVARSLARLRLPGDHPCRCQGSSRRVMGCRVE